MPNALLAHRLVRAACKNFMAASTQNIAQSLQLLCRCEATYTRILGEQLSGKGIDVNACCPGYVDTDMSSHRGHKTPAEGADTPVWLALLAKKGTTAKFFSERSEEAF